MRVFLLIIIAVLAIIGLILLIVRLAKRKAEKKDPRNTLFRKKHSRKLNELRELYLNETKTTYETREDIRNR